MYVISHPQLIGPCGYEAADEVLVLVVAVVRVCRMARLGTLLHQLEVAQQLQEGVTAGYPVAKEHALRHQPQLNATNAWIHLANLLHGIHYAHNAEEVLLVALLLLVIGLL